LTEGTYRTEVGASSGLSGVYIGPLIRHCLSGQLPRRTLRQGRPDCFP